MTDVVEGSTMGVPRGKLSFTQWATISTSEGRLGLYRNLYGEDDTITRN
jgi:hypothetical protein